MMSHMWRGTRAFVESRLTLGLLGAAEWFGLAHSFGATPWENDFRRASIVATWGMRSLFWTLASSLAVTQALSTLIDPTLPNWNPGVAVLLTPFSFALALLLPRHWRIGQIHRLLPFGGILAVGFAGTQIGFGETVSSVLCHYSPPLTVLTAAMALRQRTSNFAN